jgi:hypothetical protein
LDSLAFHRSHGSDYADDHVSSGGGGSSRLLVGISSLDVCVFGRIGTLVELDAAPCDNLGNFQHLRKKHAIRERTRHVPGGVDVGVPGGDLVGLLDVLLVFLALRCYASEATLGPSADESGWRRGEGFRILLREFGEGALAGGRHLECSTD